jgi:dihydrofolate reductase
MGRKTWESLPNAFRPLPGRVNIVVSRNAGFEAPGASVVASLEAAVAAADGFETAFVIGGAELYRQALPLADRLLLTEIDQAYEGDAFFPDFDRSTWHETTREPRIAESGLPFAFVTYERR